METKQAMKQTDIIEFCIAVENEGLIVDRNLTGQAIARKFGLSVWEGQQSVDWYLQFRNEQRVKGVQ